MYFVVGRSFQIDSYVALPPDDIIWTTENTNRL